MFMWNFFDSVFPVFFMVTFVLIFGVFIFTFIRGIGTWHQNNNSPRLTVEAILVTKRTNTTHHHDSDHHMTHTDTSYYATFEVGSGDRMEFLISGQEFGMLVEGDRGWLSFQGTRYLGFERER